MTMNSQLEDLVRDFWLVSSGFRDREHGAIFLDIHQAIEESVAIYNDTEACDPSRGRQRLLSRLQSLRNEMIMGRRKTKTKTKTKDKDKVTK